MISSVGKLGNVLKVGIVTTVQTTCVLLYLALGMMERLDGTTAPNVGSYGVMVTSYPLEMFPFKDQTAIVPSPEQVKIAGLGL